MLSTKQMQDAVADGSITEAEYREWLSLSNRAERLQDLDTEFRFDKRSRPLTQQEVADILGVDQATVSRMEKRALTKIGNISQD